MPKCRPVPRDAPPRRRAAGVQGDLFDTPAPQAPSVQAEQASAGSVGAAPADEQWTSIAAQLGDCFGGRLYLGTSSWSFPGWAGLVWDDRPHSESDLSRHGLAAYARHPLLRTVSLDRTFYRAIDAATYATLARQTPDDFRFVVKAPSEITDALIRAADSGAPLQDNPHFLDPQRALATAVLPAVDGLGDKLGALVFQISPLPAAWLRNSTALLDRFSALWRAVVPAMPTSALTAVELRDARILTPRFTAHLAQHRIRYCVGLHDRMPPAASQTQASLGAGPGDFVCRWNLHQGLRYNQAKAQWAPFERLQAPDVQTREALARAVVAALADGHRAFVTINNKAEGSAPLSVIELAKAILRETGVKAS
jgi:uncharacterized protein YecE (DUF72 family)